MNKKRLIETDLLLESPSVVKIQVPHGSVLLEMNSESDASEALNELRNYFKSNKIFLYGDGCEVSLTNVTTLESIITNLPFSPKIVDVAVRCDRAMARKAAEHKLDHLDDVKFVNELLNRSLDAEYLFLNATAAGFRPLRHTPFGLLLVKPTGAALLFSRYQPFHPTDLFNLVYGDGIDQTVWLVSQGTRT